MPTISTRLAYALEVDAADLVAALEIDVQFRSVVQTLQLCNMFGGTATITKLPTELIDLIEEHMAAYKLEAIAQRQHEVKKLYGCAEGSCTAYNHMSDSEKLIRLNGALHKTGEDELKSLQESGLAPWKVESFVMELYLDGKEHLGLGVDEQERLLDTHAENVEEWQTLVGKAGLVDCGLFSRHSEFLRRYYGLEVFVAYSSSWDRGRAITYLTLPDGRGRDSRTEVELFDEKPEHQGVGFGVACEIVTPKELTDGQKARFVEMVTGLAMPDWELADSEDEKRALAAPMLTMLTHVGIEQCSRVHQEDRKIDVSVPWEALQDLDLGDEE
ncbi:hypothetical protein LTR56_013163 [Elasticomyces elasticus]|nr:hypothetical protein LTR56_013163 [Elasticomyces elasticus]KAK3656661.1 hypothetical protein LTR22_009640 [Elasticomyces elasticus]KAK4921533.1 hypothetical protein LTR49_011003 [Elasticomyces elasticus]KAK5760221.1 hypothetical protein LTS12_009605 [Elasticomyces elasticus]